MLVRRRQCERHGGSDPDLADTRANSDAVADGSVPITQLLSVCPKTRSFSSLPVFAKLADASYLAVAADGSVWVSSESLGQVVHLSSTGAAMVTYNEHTPEGIVVLPNGHVLVPSRVQTSSSSSTRQRSR